MQKIKCDVNKFIWSITSIDTEIDSVNGFYTIYETACENYSFKSTQVLNLVHNFPLFKYDIENDNIILITEPTDYQVDQDIWCKYQAFISDDIKSWFKFKTNDQMKAIYDVSPEWKQQLIYDNIHWFWGAMVNQWNTNLGFEILHKLMCEYMYIKEVEQRELTVDETTVFHAWLTDMHSHNNMLFIPGQTKVFESPNWYQPFFNSLFPSVDYIRNLAIQQRMYICGR